MMGTLRKTAKEPPHGRRAGSTGRAARAHPAPCRSTRIANRSIRSAREATSKARREEGGEEGGEESRRQKGRRQESWGEKGRGEKSGEKGGEERVSQEGGQESACAPAPTPTSPRVRLA